MANLALFIDGGYLDKLADEDYRVRVDMGKLVGEVLRLVKMHTTEPIELLRTYYYHCPPYQGNPPTPDEIERYRRWRRFRDSLVRIPRFTFREGRLRFKGYDARSVPLFEQKRVDLMLGLDLAILSGKQRISHVALLAGDSDLIPAFEVAKAEGVSCWLFHGPRSSRKDGSSTYAFELWQAADERWELTQELMTLVARQERLVP